MRNCVKVGAIGHKDLADELEYYAKVKESLIALKIKYSSKELQLYTLLSEGADQLIVQTAVEMGIEFHVLLPMPTKFYVKDFQNPNALNFFYTFISKAKQVSVLSYYEGNCDENIAEYDVCRAFQYRAAGYKLARDCDEIIALFDGDTENKKLGGTADIVAYRVALNKPIINIRCKRVCLDISIKPIL
jgi:hypothetical protein